MGKIHISFEIDELDFAEMLVKKHARMQIAMPTDMPKQKKHFGLPALLAPPKKARGNEGPKIAARLFMATPEHVITPASMRDAYEKHGFAGPSYSGLLTKLKNSGHVIKKKPGEWKATAKGLAYFRNLNEELAG